MEVQVDSLTLSVVAGAVASFLFVAPLSQLRQQAGVQPVPAPEAQRTHSHSPVQLPISNTIKHTHSTHSHIPVPVHVTHRPRT